MVVVLDCSVVAIFAVGVGVITVGIAAHVHAPKYFGLLTVVLCVLYRVAHNGDDMIVF